MRLTPQEIEQQKKLHGAEAVNFFVRFMEAREVWRRLPDYFIKEVILNSDDIRTNKILRGGNNITNKRKVQKLLGNRAAETSTRKKDDA